LPPGYDLGAGTYELFPGTRSGFAVTVGSDASRTIIGVLLDTDGSPVPLLVGELRSIGSGDKSPIPMFTNRNGRFSAGGLKSGRYELFMADRGSTGLIIDIPRDASGLVNVGRLTVKEGAQ
jgi:outer membrane usher protein